MKKRYLEMPIRRDLKQKMVFVGGPRQVGKTIIAEMIAGGFSRSVYLNWDNRQHRRRILDAQWSPDAQLLVFDEIHKYSKWKSLIKGIWDTRPKHQQIIVTGSSKLDIYRRGGDSLMGRYHYYRLHPFSLREINSFHRSPRGPKQRPRLRFPARPGKGLNQLMRFGGFPEPFLSGNPRTLRRWQHQRFERVFREDIRDTEIIRSLSQVEILGGLLPERVGSPLSYISLSSDIEASPKSIRSWIELLCRNYYAFRVPPYVRRLQRAIKKESKYFLWDWSEVNDEGSRFENLIGAHLLKYAHYIQDSMGYSVDLYYLRDLEKREVDFLLTWKQKPWIMVECKTKPGGSLTPLAYFADRLDLTERYVLTLESGVDHADKRTGIRSISADRFLMALV